VKIKIYSDIDKIKDVPSWGYVFPLLELLQDETSDLYQFYEFTTIETCDFIALPVTVDYLLKNNAQYAKVIFEKSDVYKKKMLVFSASDIGKTINHPNFITIRLGGFNSKFKHTTYIMPPFIDDPYILLNKKISFLSKEEKASIGFVGHSNGSFIKLIKEFLIYLKFNINRMLKKTYFDYQPFYPSSYYRYRYLKIIENNKSILSNFIYRKKYRAGITSKGDRLRTTIEFYQNVFDNPYTFCMRGTGNFSVRLYETLAMGRIPVVINTDCKFPFDELINWDNHCLIIEEENVRFIGEILNQFHAKFTDSEFVALQKANRKLWEDYFKKDSFFIRLCQELLKNK
jgi:hypothetical protein